VEGRRAPQGLDAEDRIALGLTAQHLGYLVICSLTAYAVLTSHLPGVLKYPLAVFAAGLGAALAWGRLAHRSVGTWLWLGIRFGLRPRRSAPSQPERQPHRRRASAAGKPILSWHTPPAAAVELATVERLGAETVVTNSAAGEAIVEHDPIEAAEPRIIRLPHVEPSDDEVALQDRAPTNAFPGETPVFIGATQRIAFFSLKGGVGRTTLATEAAALLARDARHRAAVGAPPERLRVALLDIDMGSANVSMKLGLTHPTLWDLVIEPAPTADSVDRCLLEHDDSGLRVLLGPPRAISGGESRAIAMQRIAQVLHHLDEQNFHFVFVDMASEVNELTTYGLEASHQIYYVLTPTASAVQDTYRGVETLRRMGHRRKLRFVLNQSRGAFDASEMMADLGGTLSATVARDDAFLLAEDGHRPASLDQSGAARRSIAELAAAIYPSFVDMPSQGSVWRRLRQRLG
jgi:MinD-like ATPase involved in chromosome partitioning or flagellar assembly